MLKEIVKNYLEPILKESGFKKKAYTWNKSVNGIIQVIDIQVSRFSKKNEESFTVNIGIFNPLIWKKCWCLEIPKIIHEQDCFPRLRISELQNTASDKSNDYWWNCTPETDEASLAKELTDLIMLKCIPFLDSMLDVQNIMKFYAHRDRNLLPIEKIYFAIINNEIGCHDIEKILLSEVSAISSSWAERVNIVRSHTT